MSAVKYVKAHCVRHNKWFALEVDQIGSRQQVVNFVNMSEDSANSITTELPDTSYQVHDALRACCKCGSRKAGRCSHTEELGLCGAPYSYQCLFCSQLKISKKQATSKFSEWCGVSNIPGATPDRFGNPEGSEYDLAKDGSFDGSKVVILCLYTGENILNGIRQPIKAMEKKGFTVQLRTSASANELHGLLSDACQLWVISDRTEHLDNAHLDVIRDFYQRGHGLYIFGDNDPFYADANFLAKKLLGTSLSGNTPGDKVIGVQTRANTPGIIPGHPITTGIVNLYEGITIATVQTTSSVRPLVISSDKVVVTGILDEDGRRAMVDGGFTRLFHKWDTAGTDRFIVNSAAWLANIENTGGDVSFT